MVYLVITRELFTLLNLFIGTDIIKKIYILTSLGIYSQTIWEFSVPLLWEGADVRYRIKPGKIYIYFSSKLVKNSPK